ncbi:MAG: DUF4258 domain-containing protein [Candidatus Omnitrophota bacterium]
MKFIYTNHANLRINQRELRKDQVEKAVSRPDKTLSSFKGRMIVQKNFENQTIEVVYKTAAEEIIIITAYWLKER